MFNIFIYHPSIAGDNIVKVDVWDIVDKGED